MVHRLLFAAALLCAAPTFADSSARKAIDALNGKYTEAIAKGDAAAIAALYDEHALLMPNFSPEARGREAIKVTFESFIKSGLKKVQLTTTDVQVSGNFAVEAGQFVVTFAPEGKPEMSDTGKYLLVWKKSHGEWRAFRDIWNSSHPPPRPTSEGGEKAQAEQPKK